MQASLLYLLSVTTGISKPSNACWFSGDMPFISCHGRHIFAQKPSHSSRSQPLFSATWQAYASVCSTILY